MSKVTEWYPASVKPVWDGKYQIRNHAYDGIREIFFRGGKWWRDSSCRVPSYFQSWEGSEWRGLAEKPA